MVNREELVVELEKFGVVMYCNPINEITYLIVMDNWTGTIEDFNNILDVFVVSEYPNNITRTLVDGVLKSQQDK